MAVFAPIPSASERIAAPANTGLNRSSRAPNLKSLQSVSTRVSQLTSRTSCFTNSTPPISIRAVRHASSRVIPPRIFSIVDFSRKSRSSSSISCSIRLLPKSPRIPPQRFVHISFIPSYPHLCPSPVGAGLAPPAVPPLLTRRLQNPRDGRDLPLPLLRFALELLSPTFCQRIIFRSPVILRSPPLAFQKPSPLQPPKRRKKRSGIHLEHAVAQLLNSLRNPPPMQRLQRQRLQNQ